MNITKKTIFINEYSKKVDEIIASGKSVDEQLVDMLEMVGGKVVTTGTEPSKINKRIKTVK